MATFADLPPELLFDIFRHLDRETLRDKACFVNREWSTVATLSLARELSFSQPRLLLLWKARCEKAQLVPFVESLCVHESLSYDEQLTWLLTTCGRTLTELRLVSCPLLLAKCSPEQQPFLTTLYFGGGSNLSSPVLKLGTPSQLRDRATSRLPIRTAFLGAFLSLDVLTHFVRPRALRHLCISSEAFKHSSTLSTFMNELVPWLVTLEVYITSPYFYSTDWSWLSTSTMSLTRAAVDIVLLTSFLPSIPHVRLDTLAVSFANPFESVSDPEYEVDVVRRALSNNLAASQVRTVEWRWRDDAESDSFASLMPPLAVLTEELEGRGVKVVHGRQACRWHGIDWWKPALRSYTGYNR